MSDHHGTRASVCLRRFGRLAIVVYLLIVTAIAAPILLNRIVRAEYLEQVSKAASRYTRPSYLMIGDSITREGYPWGWRLIGNPLSAVTRAQPGSTAFLLHGLTDPAGWGFRPRVISLMAGTPRTRCGPDGSSLSAAEQSGQSS